MSKVETISFTSDLPICRIINGMWQVAGGHGQINEEMAISEMLRYHESGFTTWDLADIYGPAEEFIGKFRRLLEMKKGKEEITKMQAFTKFVPNPGPMSKSIVEYHIDQSIQRMKVELIDLVQFHWWDYNNISYMDALHHLSKLQDEGKIRNLGLTNFDTERVKIITEQGFKLVSNQIQYSIIDQRPEIKMVPFCLKHDIKVLTYGTVLGGFLSERYLGKPEPTREGLATMSLQKYKNMIDLWGGWPLFQELLRVLDKIAKKHDSTITNVAAKYILDKPSVAGIIIGARLGISDHRTNNERIFDLDLDGVDLLWIKSVTAKSNNLFEVIGDCGDEYR